MFFKLQYIVRMAYKIQLDEESYYKLMRRLFKALHSWIISSSSRSSSNVKFSLSNTDST